MPAFVAVKYTDEFRRETADYIISTGRPITECCAELGRVLGRWRSHRAPLPAFGHHAETEIDVSTDSGQIQIQLARIVGNAPNARHRGSSVAYLRL